MSEKMRVRFPIGLIAEWKIDPGLFIHDTFHMRKGQESSFSVIRSHSAFTEPAEAHFTGGKVNDRIVDASAAESAERHDSAGGASVLGEEIKRQRVLHGVDLSDRLIQSIKGYDGEKRTEDFFLHNGIIESRRRK